ncbi:MAG: response regulator, partial [Pedobacter sp.]
MFKRVLINEDHESANISVRQTLGELGITGIGYTYYCDDAYTQIKKSLQDEQPFELLITDLSFEEDHRAQRITDGIELIRLVRELNPGLKVLVFSAENKAAAIDLLFKQLNI